MSKPFSLFYNRFFSSIFVTIIMWRTVLLSRRVPIVRATRLQFAPAPSHRHLASNDIKAQLRQLDVLDTRGTIVDEPIVNDKSACMLL
jgi:hypothetical protein